MLQFTESGFLAHQRLAAEGGFPPPWTTMEELRAAADDYIGRVLAERSRLSRERGGVLALADALDRAVRTDEIEYLDDPDFPEDVKQRMVRALHHLNLSFFSYHRFVRILAPLVREAAARHGRPARVLELASGSGEFTLAMARLAVRRRLPVVITGSDYIPTHVAEGNRRARERGLPVEFREINAFAMDKSVAPGEFDIVFIAQSIHHFSPGQLAMMIAQARATATTAFVGVDGYRCLPLVGILPGLAALKLRKSFIHDAWITSRRLFTELELSLAAGIAAPDSPSLVVRSWPFHSVLFTRFDLARSTAKE